MSIDAILSDLKNRQSEAISKLFEFLKIKSISTDPAFKNECKVAATWIKKEIESLGLSSFLYNEGEHPLVFGMPAKADENKPTYLFYGHYDVQPIDPIELWDFNPFEPRLIDKDGKKVIHGRGSSDDKGQILTFFEACRSVMNVYGDLPFNLKILIEGEEEIGSQSMSSFIKKNKQMLSCDYAIICDTGFEQNRPSIYTMLRGEISSKVTIRTAKKDLHSGIYGGAATNPIKVLSLIISKIHDRNGKISIPDFYKDVEPLDPTVMKNWQSIGFNEKEFLQDVGLTHSAGEKSFSLIENLWSRPSCEITGMSGGYLGSGFKTVIPCEATATVSFRLVNNQNPENIKNSFEKFVRSNLPPDCRVFFQGKYGSKASIVRSDSRVISLASEAIIEEWGTEPILAGCGASIPIITDLKEILNVDSLLLGFARDNDNIHAPNEKYDLQSFIKGSNTWARIIEKL